MRNLLKEENERGATILLASHNSGDIDTLCDEIYKMERGEIVEVIQKHAAAG